jgi:hypothetical protein
MVRGLLRPTMIGLPSPMPFFLVCTTSKLMSTATFMGTRLRGRFSSRRRAILSAEQVCNFPASSFQCLKRWPLSCKQLIPAASLKTIARVNIVLPIRRCQFIISVSDSPKYHLPFSGISEQTCASILRTGKAIAYLELMAALKVRIFPQTAVSQPYVSHLSWRT